MAEAVPQHTTSLKLDAELRDRLRRLAEARRRTPHWLMREAIAQYVGREGARAQLRPDALAAWAEYEATGRHATGEAVDAWLARLHRFLVKENPDAARRAVRVILRGCACSKPTRKRAGRQRT